MAVMIVISSEQLGLEQRVDQVNKQAGGHEAGERIIEEHHGAALTADRRHKRRRSTGRKRQSRSPPSAHPTWQSSRIKMWDQSRRRVRHLRERRAGAAGPAAVKCQQAHRNSRGPRACRYRNSIKNPGPAGSSGARLQAHLPRFP